jgi:hypothetical protein
MYIPKIHYHGIRPRDTEYNRNYWNLWRQELALAPNEIGFSVSDSLLQDYDPY